MEKMIVHLDEGIPFTDIRLQTTVGWIFFRKVLLSIK